MHDRVGRHMKLSSLGIFYLSTLWAGAFLLLLLVALVAVSPRVKRSIVWINLCVSMIIYSVSLSLLVFVNKTNGPEPSFALCLTQASLVYAAPVLAGFSTLALVVHIWLDHRSAMAGHRVGPSKKIMNIIFILIPYLGCIAIVAEIVVIGLRYPHQVQRYGALPQCGLRKTSPAFVSGGIVLVVLIVAGTFQTLIARSLWRLRRRVQLSSMEHLPLTPVSNSVMIRLGCFSFVTLFTLLVTAASWGLPKDRDRTDGFICFIPLAFFFIFGTQKDILQAAAFWKRTPARDPEGLEMT